MMTEEECKAFNECQQRADVHPYTCGGNRTDANHLDGEGVLVAVRNGLFCPYCSYVQEWSGVVPDLNERNKILQSLPEAQKSGVAHAIDYWKNKREAKLFVYEIGNGMIGCSYERSYVIAASVDEALDVFHKTIGHVGRVTGVMPCERGAISDLDDEGLTYGG